MWKSNITCHLNSISNRSIVQRFKSKFIRTPSRIVCLRKASIQSDIFCKLIYKDGFLPFNMRLNFVEGCLIFKRAYGTRSSQKFSSVHAANQFVRWLLPEERATLFEALKEFESEENLVDVDSAEPTSKQLKLVAVSNAIPFIGFGFLDNAIMILAGEYIDHTVGLTLGISTMAAAAVGNLISDLMGLGLAGYVESIAIKLGFDVPPMSTRQASMWKTKYTAYLGRGIGITIGCLIGMFPLLFIDAIENEHEEIEHV